MRVEAVGAVAADDARAVARASLVEHVTRERRRLAIAA
jgi:hypothetical protein